MNQPSQQNLANCCRHRFSTLSRVEAWTKTDNKSQQLRLHCIDHFSCVVCITKYIRRMRSDRYNGVAAVVTYARQHICDRPSVRLSVTRYMYHRKTVEVRIMKFSPYGRPIPLVFVGQVSSRNSNGSPPPSGCVKQERWVKSAVFVSLSVNISKTVADTAKVTING